MENKLLSKLKQMLANISGKNRPFVMPHVSTNVHFGLKSPFTIIHISDVHIANADKSEEKSIIKTAQRRNRRFGYPTRKLDYITEYSQRHSLPMVITGDLIDFITDANLQKSKEFLLGSGNDIIAYTVGNHEYARRLGDENEETPEYRAASLPLLNALSPNDVRFHVAERCGVTFIAIDNSMHQIEPEQLASLKQAVSVTQNPIVLLMHAPLYEPSLFNHMLKTGSDSAYVMGAPKEKLSQYSPMRFRSQCPTQTTMDACAFIKSTPQIKLILAGHVHQVYECDITKDLKQLVVDTDTFREITFD